MTSKKNMQRLRMLNQWLSRKGQSVESDRVSRWLFAINGVVCIIHSALFSYEMQKFATRFRVSGNDSDAVRCEVIENEMTRPSEIAGHALGATVSLECRIVNIHQGGKLATVQLPGGQSVMMHETNLPLVLPEGVDVSLDDTGMAAQRRKPRNAPNDKMLRPQYDKEGK